MQETYGDLRGCSKIGSGVSLAVEPRSRNGRRRTTPPAESKSTSAPCIRGSAQPRVVGIVLKAVRGVLSEAGLSRAVDGRRGGDHGHLAPLRAVVSGAMWRSAPLAHRFKVRSCDAVSRRHGSRG